jgi:hypothetical protein
MPAEVPWLEPGEHVTVGNYYASQGPEFHDITLDDGQITVTCSPCATIILSEPSAHARQTRGDALAGSSFALDGFERASCRIPLIDAEGKRAWSNPIWLDCGARLMRSIDALDCGARGVARYAADHDWSMSALTAGGYV